ncbi:MAG: DUF354 domain-containing protein [Gaiellaceae bacterium]
MKAWIDIDNPPQVQYLVPFKAAFEAAGHDVVITARDRGITLELLEQRGIRVIAGKTYSGAWSAQKALGVMKRAYDLRALFARGDRPDLVVTASRGAVIAARHLGIPAFTFCDYEHVDLRVARAMRASVIFPDAINPSIFIRKGFHPARLIPFHGLKEVLSFSEVDLPNVRAFAFPGMERDERVIRILFRPPAEEAHYFARESMELALSLLGWFARRDGVRVVFAPRYERQSAYLDRFQWINQPFVLQEAVPFVSLLKAVDAVVSSGGTMLREAAYLGIPAYSILRSEIGSIDRMLQAHGRLRILTSVADFETAAFEKVVALAPLHTGGVEVIADVVDQMTIRTLRASHRA